jgi:hypothetical protein
MVSGGDAFRGLIASLKRADEPDQRRDEHRDEREHGEAPARVRSVILVLFVQLLWCHDDNVDEVRVAPAVRVERTHAYGD